MILHLISLLLLTATAWSQSPPWPPKFGYFQQKITHFNFPNKFPTFRTRYLYEDKWYKSGGPIFFYCGNEGDIEGFWNNTGFMFDIAPGFNALVVFAEHRYYGQSLPFPSSFTQPFIQFLTIEEALADFADLISVIQATFNATSSPVIAFGGSYGGMLAAVMRLKYPHLVHGAIASSAPFKWVLGEEPLHPFFQTIKNDYFNVNASCVSVIQTAYETILQRALSGAEGLKNISQSLRLCSPLQNQSDLDWMLRWSRNAFVFMTMMDYPYQASFMGNLPAYPVNVSCLRAINETDPLVGLREALGVFYNTTNVSCFDYKSQYLDCADITGCGLGNDSIAWDFQSCTEMHLYDPSNATAGDMFPSLPRTLEQVNEYCERKFGVSLAENQLRTFIGPTAVWKHASNIVFSNGDLDPWMNGGFLEPPSKSVTVLQIHGGAHHLDLRGSNPADPPSVTEARQTEFAEIRKWLTAFYKGRMMDDFVPLLVH